MPSAHAIATIALSLGMLVVFAQGRIKVEVICLVVIGLLAVGFSFFPIEGANGKNGIEIAFGGFGHEALITICCLMILGRGLVATGALDPASQLLARLWAFNNQLGLLCSLVVCGAMSMFINDTPVLVLAMPILLTLAKRTGFPASRTLMPVNFAILIGGMSTTIGTSTNLLVVSIASDLGLPSINVFEFTDVALMAGAVALPYLWLVMPRLLPNYGSVATESPRKFSASLFIGTNSTVVDDTLEELRAKIGRSAEIQGATRGAIHFRRHDTKVRLQPGDVVQVEGALADLRHASERAKATLAHPTILRSLPNDPSEDQIIAEVVIGADSNLIGATVRSAQIGDRFGAAVIGLYRPDRTFFHEALDTAGERLEVGDVLLIQGAPERLKQLQVSEGAMVLEGAAEMPRTLQAPVALLIAGLVVVAAALRIVPISISSLAGTIAMIATGCVKFDRVGRALSGEVILLVAASIALGKAFVVSGAAAWLGGGLSVALAPLPPAGALAAIMAFAAIITNFSSNTAAAAVTTPIAVSLALSLGLPPEPMVLAVLFGCNLCYATPVAYQTNILIMSAAGYRFQDFVRAGLPLVVIMIATLSTLLVFKYGL
jgi:di/tricarboxylate transporter